ncbi:ABC transporter permease [Bifidobacterium phasiani]|uniref:ABC transporter permease n=1 Tax=Bifidobacterium phasiani TaxID=2834431 RepID=A0ABS6W6N5_9BIFI|nr:ABC transporter permease [Bifidobacterium phasiani]MBW3081845.1 ABC transporter permease [Bifidobacterium phasiani]
MGRHQRAETAGLVSFLFCALVGGGAMNLYMTLAPAIWLVSLRMFTACSAIVAACAVVSFCIGYARGSSSFTLRRGWLVPVRRSLEILALSVVYAATAFLTSFLILNVANGIIGTQMFVGYLVGVCAGMSGVVGYLTYVQSQAMRAKTLAALLPFFVISGVGGAGMTTDDPYWFVNNFSRLGDRTTFAAGMFNTTVILAGLCVIVISYFSVAELITTYRQHAMWSGARDAGKDTHMRLFRTRLACLSLLLAASGVCFIGIGSFRQSPHPIAHNAFAFSLPCITGVLMLALPWLAPLFSKATYVVSDLMVVIGIVSVNLWLRDEISMTNLELLLIMLFFGWFVVFSRQIAAIEADRIQEQILHIQAALPSRGDDAEAPPESRLAIDK